MNKGKIYKIQEVAAFIRPPLKHLLEIENSGGTGASLQKGQGRLLSYGKTHAKIDFSY